MLDEIESPPKKNLKLPALTDAEVTDKVKKIGNGNSRQSCLPVEVRFTPISTIFC